jgi:hypothetical protein
MRTFDRFAGTSAILVGLGGLVYGVLFGAIVLGASRPVRITWLAVGLLGALLTTPVLVALYYRLRDTDRGFALLALLLGLAAALGQLENSALGLGSAVTPDIGLEGAPADPFWAFRFGLAGVALFIVGWLICQGAPSLGPGLSGRCRRRPAGARVPGTAHRRDRSGDRGHHPPAAPLRARGAPGVLRLAGSRAQAHGRVTSAGQGGYHRRLPRVRNRNLRGPRRVCTS